NLQRARLRKTGFALLTCALVILIGFASFAVVQWGRAERERQLADRARDSERLAKNFTARVADTLSELAGFVPEETEALVRKSTEAIVSGSVRDPDTLAFLQIEALVEMAHYFHDAWDARRVILFLKEAEERLGTISPASVTRPEFTKLQASRLE